MDVLGFFSCARIEDREEFVENPIPSYQAIGFKPSCSLIGNALQKFWEWENRYRFQNLKRHLQMFTSESETMVEATYMGHWCYSHLCANWEFDSGSLLTDESCIG